MDGVSFSPVSSSSLQRQAGNQICRYCSPLACYGNKASHMCFSVCMCVCLCVCAVRVLRRRGGHVCLSLKWAHIYKQRKHGKIKRPHREITSTTTFHPVKMTTTPIMFTYMESSPMNKIFHPGFKWTRWKYQHLVGSSCHYSRNQKPLLVMIGQMMARTLFPQNQSASLWTRSPFCGYIDHRGGKESYFLTDTSFNIH